MVKFTEIAQAISLSIDELFPKIQEIRRYLHQHPEPSEEEFKTTSYLAELLEDAGLNFRVGPDGRGLIVDSAADQKQPVYAFRADIDALRLNDEKTVSYRSREINLMHACGHDAHTAMAFGACMALKANAHLLDKESTWRCIFQPAEETAKGALEMVACGALKRVESIIALHVDPSLNTGQVGWRYGALTAQCEEFELLITGKGGHGARPHTTNDPIPVAAELIQSIYTNVPRSLDPREPAVVSFGVIQGGINPNVIPGSVQLRGTIRTFSPTTARIVKQRLREISDGIAQASNTSIQCTVAYSLPAVMNDKSLVDVATSALKEVLNPANLIEIEQPSMGGEDFSNYLAHVKGCMLRLGVGSPLQPIAHLHSPQFDLNEKALPIGSKALALTIAAQILNHNQRPK